MSRPREPRVLLMQLSERTSDRGTLYFCGWLGKVRLVDFLSNERARDCTGHRRHQNELRSTGRPLSLTCFARSSSAVSPAASAATPGHGSLPCG
jgi:hypothetical protein